MIHDTGAIQGDQIRTADICVIGSGPGGATVARELAERGFKVIVLEAGPRLDHETSSRDPGVYFPKFVAQGGLRVMMGNAFIASMQAEAIGGTSEINSAIFKPMPDHILKEWIEAYQLEDLSVSEMHAHFRHVERELGAIPTEAVAQGPKNEIVKRGLDKLGWDGHPLVRAVQGCEGASDCMTGCPTGAKRTMSATYIPKAVEAGAEIYPLTKARFIMTERRKAVGVVADILDPVTRKPKAEMVVHAKAVVCSAGVMISPILMRRSGVKGNGWVGKNLRGHIGVGVLAKFDEPVDGWIGATQGIGSNQFFHRGMVLETIWAIPAVFTSRLPGVGHAYKAQLKNYQHCTAIASKPRGCSTGVVREGLDGNPICFFNMRQEDVDETAFGAKVSIDALFAAGAKEVYPGTYGAPWVMTDPAQSEIMLSRKFKAGNFEFVANHVFGTCRMGSDPRKSVVNSWCETHEVRDLFVCDSSTFPTGIINNPQESIMAFSRRTALYMAERYG